MSNLQKAIRFATTVHSGQMRKGKPTVPYITHPLGVALILSRVGASEDVIVAGIFSHFAKATRDYAHCVSYA